MTPCPSVGDGPLLPQPGVAPPPHLFTLSGKTGSFSQDHPIWPALVLALVCHALLIYALGFETPRPLPTSLPALDVLVLRQADGTAATSERPDALADRAQEAAAVEDGKEATSRASEPPAAQAIPADTTAAPLSGTGQPLAAAPLAALASPASPEPPLSAATILANRGEEIARLSAKLAEDTTAYASRPRRKAISASTQEYKYASYLEAWRRKVEAIGNLNYPEEARRRKLYGNLILQVGVRADGSLEEVRVLRSSGSTLLDEAAVRIVHLAAPFAPFPPDIRQETDFLDVTRTWQFLSNNRFGGKP